MVRSLWGPRTREDGHQGKRRNRNEGGAACFPFFDVLRFQQILLVKVPPFAVNLAVEFVIWVAAHDHGMESVSGLESDTEQSTHSNGVRGCGTNGRFILHPARAVFSFQKEILVGDDGTAIPSGTERDIACLASIGVHGLTCCIGMCEPRLVLHFIWSSVQSVLLCFGNTYCKFAAVLTCGVEEQSASVGDGGA